MGAIARRDLSWWLYHHHHRGSAMDDGVTARGTATRNTKSSKDPHSSLASKRLTGPALWYKEMLIPCRNQSSSTELLLAQLGANIRKNCRADGMQIEIGKTYVWAAIIINKHFGRTVTDRDAAKQLGLECHSEYQRKYKIREEKALEWLDKYRLEANC